MGEIAFTVEGHPDFDFVVHPAKDNLIKIRCKHKDCEQEYVIEFAPDFEYTSGDIANVWDGLEHTHGV